ncbi:MAG: triose-phosphate isomerase [Rickettsiales bacterium]
MKYIVGNWKMHGTAAEGQALAAGIADAAAQYQEHAKVVLCPPATLIAQAAWWLKGRPVALGGQDCHTEDKGAFTGDVSAAMLKDAGAKYVIVGHSERRQHHGETNEIVRKKAEAAVAAGLVPILCIGETLEDRETGRTNTVLMEQVAASLPQQTGPYILIAYEPVWAIGTGRTPSFQDIDDAQQAILGYLTGERKLGQDKVCVLYGGSVKPDNAKDILKLASVGGVLVGGASLKSKDFSEIIAGV